MLALRKQLDAGLVKAIDGKAQVKVLLEDGSTYAHEGTLEFVGSAVDPAPATWCCARSFRTRRACFCRACT